MLSRASLGIALILAEGAFTVNLQAADIVCTDMVCALELLMRPLRLTPNIAKDGVYG